MATSARSSARMVRNRANFSIPCSMLPRRRMPAVSMSRIGRPARSITVSTVSRVVPGDSLTTARSSPASRFRKLDFPTFRRPPTAVRASPCLRAAFSISPVASSGPPVSTSVNSRPRHSAVAYSRSRVVPGSSSTMATRSPTRRLKSVDLPTFGRPTMATRPRLTELSLGGELLSALLHFEKRVHRGRAATDKADAVLTPQPLRLELVRVLDVVRVATLHLGKVDELARVRRILPAHDDDRVDQLRELARGMLALHSHRADGVEDLRLLRDLRDVRDEVLERPRRLRGLRDHAGFLHPRELLPLVLGLDDDGIWREAAETHDLGVLERAEDDHGVALVGELFGETLRAQDQRAGRVDALETLRLDLRPRLRRDAMRAYDDDAFLRVGGILDDLDPERAQPLADLGVVDDLAEVVHGLPGLGGGLGQLDGLFDPETEPVLAGEKHFHGIKSIGTCPQRQRARSGQMHVELST